MLTTSEERNGITYITVSPEQSDIDDNEDIKAAMQFLTDREESHELELFFVSLPIYLSKVYLLGGIEYFTAFAMALNWKGFEYRDSDPKLAAMYFEIWEGIDRVAKDTFEGEELEYYITRTD